MELKLKSNFDRVLSTDVEGYTSIWGDAFETGRVRIKDLGDDSYQVIVRIKGDADVDRVKFVVDVSYDTAFFGHAVTCDRMVYLGYEGQVLATADPAVIALYPEFEYSEVDAVRHFARGYAEKLAGGSSFADTIFAGKADDQIYGKGGDDILVGRAGADFLSGDEGNDRLNGGRGRDTLVGGEGEDVFVFETNFAKDRIRDFDLAEDRLELSEALRDGAGSVETFVDGIGTVTKAGVWLDFGGDGKILLQGLTTLDGLADVIDFI